MPLQILLQKSLEAPNCLPRCNNHTNHDLDFIILTSIAFFFSILLSFFKSFSPSHTPIITDIQQRKPKLRFGDLCFSGHARKAGCFGLDFRTYLIGYPLHGQDTRSVSFGFNVFLYVLDALFLYLMSHQAQIPCASSETVLSGHSVEVFCADITQRQF